MIKLRFFYVLKLAMWAYLYALASPKRFYTIATRLNPKLGALAFLSVLLGSIWGLFWAPPDYQQGDAFRIIYLHVPFAFLSMSLYAAMSFQAILLLVWRIKLAGLMMLSLANVGLLSTALALITGSIWGKPMWGTWWIWDARLTSELILLCLYAAILMTRASLTNTSESDRIVAVLVLVGALDLPVIHYSVYWWNTLHQGQTLSVVSAPKIATSMLYPLLINVFGFSCWAVWSALRYTQNRVIEREKKQEWVREFMHRGTL